MRSRIRLALQEPVQPLPSHAASNCAARSPPTGPTAPRAPTPSTPDSSRSEIDLFTYGVRCVGGRGAGGAEQLVRASCPSTSRRDCSTTSTCSSCCETWAWNQQTTRVAVRNASADSAPSRADQDQPVGQRRGTHRLRGDALRRVRADPGSPERVFNLGRHPAVQGGSRCRVGPRDRCWSSTWRMSVPTHRGRVAMIGSASLGREHRRPALVLRGGVWRDDPRR